MQLHWLLHAGNPPAAATQRAATAGPAIACCTAFAVAAAAALATASVSAAQVPITSIPSWPSQ